MTNPEATLDEVVIEGRAILSAHWQDNVDNCPVSDQGKILNL
jgi:hypothetical protein